jgi:addiction module HigA family antidote
MSRLSTTTEGAALDEFAPVTPGEVLREEFLKEYGLSQNRLAKAIGISPNRIAEIVGNRRRITADTALRLGLYFGNSPEFWLNLQTGYDLKIAARQISAADAERIAAHRAAQAPQPCKPVHQECANETSAPLAAKEADDPPREGVGASRPLTPDEALAQVRRLGLSTPRAAAALIREDRDGR